jgi:hypothetical protein
MCLTLNSVCMHKIRFDHNNTDTLDHDDHVRNNNCGTSAICQQIIHTDKFDTIWQG